MSKARKPLSLHPLSFEDALANLIAVKPKKKTVKKRKAARKKTKKKLT
jgi:hypothetical protein